MEVQKKDTNILNTTFVLHKDKTVETCEMPSEAEGKLRPPSVVWTEQSLNRSVLSEVEKMKMLASGAETDANADKSHLLDRLSIPGLKNACDPKMSFCYKTFWTILIMLCCAISIYQIGTRIRLYASFPRTFRTNIELLNEVTFPALTICYFLDSGFPKLEELRKKYKEVQNATSCSHPLDFVGYEGLTIDDIWSFTDATKLVSASFERSEQKIPLPIKVNLKEIKTILGKCATISIDNKFIYYEGRGLELKVTTALLRSKCSSKHVGFYWHPVNESVRHFVNQQLAYYINNIVTFTVLSVKKVVFMNLSTDPCVDEDTFYKCQDNCFEKLLQEKMNCRLPFMEESSLSDCTTPQTAHEALREANQVYSSDQYCRESCVRKCVNERIKVSSYPHPATSDDNVPHYIQFEDNSFQTVTEVALYDAVSFLSDIGGTLGLFLGVCILHLLELLDVFFRLCRQKWTNRKTKVRVLNIKQLFSKHSDLREVKGTYKINIQKRAALDG